ncbi:MAG: ATP-binding protein [Candidatus Dormibacteraeota bacterium]|nr:ATP-binding protein [Candidatus Dormibacteraeota bacterium]
MIDETQARSAILFGPPGTSKTTLVEALAGALGWNYLEILASDFLSEGIDNVPARADAIFSQIMELDRCVILFDEIDELLRDRSAAMTDPFGRFLTTSMLPKLARLWEQRRVLFFVNTNWIDRADPAIRRSQRFDAALFVAPPNFGRKLERLQGLLTDDATSKLTALEVEKALKGKEKSPLGWFALLRHDQLEDLRARLKRQKGSTATFAQLERELTLLGRQLEMSDWHSPEPRKHAYRRFLQMRAFERIDATRRCLARLDRQSLVSSDGREVLPGRVGAEECYMDLQLASPPPKVLQGDTWTSNGDVLLQFTVIDAPQVGAPLEP